MSPSTSPTDEDWADYHEWRREVEVREQDREDAMREQQYVDWLDEQHKFTDQDMIRNGFPV